MPDLPEKEAWAVGPGRRPESGLMAKRDGRTGGHVVRLITTISRENHAADPKNENGEGTRAIRDQEEGGRRSASFLFKER